MRHSDITGNRAGISTAPTGGRRTFSAFKRKLLFIFAAFFICSTGFADPYEKCSRTIDQILARYPGVGSFDRPKVTKRVPGGMPGSYRFQPVPGVPALRNTRTSYIHLDPSLSIQEFGAFSEIMSGYSVDPATCKVSRISVQRVDQRKRDFLPNSVETSLELNAETCSYFTSGRPLPDTSKLYSSLEKQSYQAWPNYPTAAKSKVTGLCMSFFRPVRAAPQPKYGNAVKTKSDTTSAR